MVGVFYVEKPQIIGVMICNFQYVVPVIKIIIILIVI